MPFGRSLVPDYNGFAVIGNTVSTPRYFQVGGYLRF